MKNIAINHINKEIIVTSNFYKKAGSFGTKEYEALVKVMKDNSDYAIVVQKRGDSLTKEEAELYLIRSGNEEMLNKFREMCNKEETLLNGKKSKVYKWFHIRNWFYENFPKYNEEKKLMEEEEKLPSLEVV